ELRPHVRSPLDHPGRSTATANTAGDHSTAMPRWLPLKSASITRARQGWPQVGREHLIRRYLSAHSAPSGLVRGLGEWPPACPDPVACVGSRSPGWLPSWLPVTASLSVLGTREVADCEPAIGGSRGMSGRPHGCRCCCHFCCHPTGMAGFRDVALMGLRSGGWPVSPSRWICRSTVRAAVASFSKVNR